MRILSSSSEAPTSRSEPTNTNADPTTNSETSTSSTPSAVSAPSSKVPTVVLDTDAVSDNMAARLCISLLGHVLFLKNQVPFPIVQLAKMPTSDHTSRAARKRQELLGSLDTLASHLYTTFIALSTALALRGSPEKAAHERGRGAARAFFAVALGPTVGTAKSRVIVGIDGLETKVWGLREDAVRTRDVPEEEGEEDASEGTSDTDEEDEESEEEGGECSEEEDEGEDVASPPPSRSPSPSDEDDVPPSTSRTEDPETVRAAERLLSRTLASACAEDDGHGLASEMAPTQIHVLLRAPRRFDHPCWIPRQNLCTSLEGHLAEFLVESGEGVDTANKKRTRAGKVQGVWVKSRGGASVEKDDEGGVAEEDELIWWSWDGKLVGFSDW